MGRKGGEIGGVVTGRKDETVGGVSGRGRRDVGI
jgi:hypothetical protein